MLGNKDVSRKVAAHAAIGSGIGASIIQAMLPYIIQMVIGAFTKQTSGGLGDILSKIPQMGSGDTGGAA